MSKSKTIPASRFKAECLALLDRVAQTGESLVVTKRGRAVAKVVPIVTSERRSLRGSVRVVGDLVASTGVSWEADE